MSDDVITVSLPWLTGQQAVHPDLESKDYRIVVSLLVELTVAGKVYADVCWSVSVDSATVSEGNDLATAGFKAMQIAETTDLAVKEDLTSVPEPITKGKHALTMSFRTDHTRAMESAFTKLTYEKPLTQIDALALVAKVYKDVKG